MECTNVIKLRKLKGEFIERLNRTNYIIKYANRSKITVEMIHQSQLIREYLEKDINICNSLLNNNIISSMDIEEFVNLSTFHISNIDNFLKTIERVIH